MARETEKDYDHTYWNRGEQALLDHLGLPEYSTHSAERAYYYYTSVSKRPYVVKIENYRNQIERILEKRGVQRGSKVWRNAMEDICYDCDCWGCPCDLLGDQCVSYGGEIEEALASRHQGVSEFWGCRNCEYCMNGLMGIYPLGAA